MSSRQKRTSPIRRGVLLPLSFGLAVLTAIGLLLLAQSVTTAPPIRADGGAGPGNELAVRRFYDAVDRVLRGSGEAALARSFAPEALDPATAAATPSPTGALVGRLAAARRAYPDLQFTVETLVADGNLVVARIAATATRRQTGRGLAIDGAPLVWNGTDRFGFADGLIVEYVAGWESIVAPNAGWSAAADHPPEGQTQVAVVRFTLAPGAWLPSVKEPSTSVLYVVESGRLLALQAARPTDGLLDASKPLRAGDRLLVHTGVSVGVENHGTTAAVVLAVVLFPFAPVLHDETRDGPPGASQTVADRVLAIFAPVGGAESEVAWSSGLTVRGLAAMVIAGPGSHSLVVSGDPAVLAPGEAIGTHRVDEAEFLLVDAGSASLVATSPDLRVLRASGNVRPASPGVVEESGPANDKTVVLSTGDAAAIAGGTVQAVRNVGGDPLSVIVLTIAPAGDPK